MAGATTDWDESCKDHGAGIVIGVRGVSGKVTRAGVEEWYGGWEC
jgi:hypothetical protein